MVTIQAVLMFLSKTVMAYITKQINLPPLMAHLHGEFGRSVAIDNGVVVIGAWRTHGHGSAYVFTVR